VMRSGAKQEITGLVVNQAPGRPPARVPRVFVRKLRAAIHNRRQGRPGKGESLQQLRGWAAYIMMADRERGRAFMAEIDELQAAGSPNSEEQP
jgi:RNA-directed DNA polymerase